MAQTSIKAAQFSGVVGNGESGYVLQSSGNGNMSWVASITPPTVTSLSYPGSATAADPAGGQTVTLTGTGFASGATVTVGGTTAPAVSFVSATTLTITTPVKAAGDYDVVVTNTDTGSATFINGISYNGIPTWTTAAGSLGTFASAQTISTITLQATEPDAGTITFNITNGALPTGLSLTGANIDGTTSLETAETLYTFTVTATDDESQTTPRVFTITVQKQFKSYENFTINTYTGNGSTLAVEGKIGTAASFNGSSSHIDLGTTDFVQNNNSFSISAWCYFEDLSTANAIVTKWWNNSGIDESWWFGHYAAGSTTLHFAHRDASNNVTLSYSNTSAISENTWHHCVVVWNGSTVTYYVDGTQVGTSTNSDFNSATKTSSANIIIGAQNEGSGNQMTGKIDQVRLFNKAISSSEVTTLYGESNTSTTKSTTDIFDDGSGVALYEFEEGAKDTGGVTGYIGSGGMFNGSSSVVSTDLNFATNAKSVSLWFKISDTNVYGSVVSSNNNGTGDPLLASLNWHCLQFDSTGNVLTFSILTGNWERVSTTTNNFNVNTWYNVTVTHDASSIKIYINGNLENTTTLTGTILSQDIIEIGGNTNASGVTPVYFNGLIDQVRIFNRVLDEATDGEVTTLYNETSASATKSTTDIFDDDSSVALYELEGNANDTPKGTIDAGQSAVFNGSSSYLGVSSFSFGSDNITVSMWVNPASTQTAYSNIFDFSHSSGTAGSFTIQQNNANTNQYKIWQWDGSNYNETTTVALAANQWNHLVFTLQSNGSYVIYVNKSSALTGSNLTASTSGVTQTLNIGRWLSSGTPGRYFNGKIDQIRIYSSALSSSDVTNLYNESNVPTANLVAHYKLDGNANDETTSYNGTATSITYTVPAEFPTYNGTATNVSYAYDGTPTNVSFVGTSFQPDLVWIKERNNSVDHLLFDTIRGAGVYQRTNLASNEPAPQLATLSSFDSNGFSVGSDGGVNGNNDTYVAWCWKAGGAAVSNTDGTITSTVSANVDAGFSIVTFDGNQITGETVGHGLTQAPELIIIKRRSAANNWLVLYSDTGIGGYLDLTDVFSTSNYNFWTDFTNPTNTVVTLGGYSYTNGTDMLMYAFHSVDGYQKVGSYTGVAGVKTVSGLGFQPRFIMVRYTGAGGRWIMVDSVRGDGGFNVMKLLQAQDSAAETTNAVYGLTFTSDGFTIPSGASSNLNANGYNYIYLAIK